MSKKQESGKENGRIDYECDTTTAVFNAEQYVSNG